MREQVPADWYARYGRRIEDYRLPKGQEASLAYVAQVGMDGHILLTALAAPETPEALRHLRAVELLGHIWEQQFETHGDGQWRLRDADAMPPASERVESPYEPAVRFATKRQMHWVGYKVHLTETCDDDLPHLITQVETTIAPATDLGQLARIQQSLADQDLLPSEHLVDAGSTRDSNIVESREQHQIDLVGPADEDQMKIIGGRLGWTTAWSPSNSTSTGTLTVPPVPRTTPASVGAKHIPPANVP